MDNLIYISFIVPIYNVMDYVEECIQSMTQICRSDIEIILINDGSTDESLSICRRHAEKDKRIQVITQENRGVSASRNRGMALARGKWICFVDGDDCLCDDFENVIVKKIDDSVDLNYFGFQRMQGNGRPEGIAHGLYALTEEELNKLRMRILNRDMCEDKNKFPATILFDAPVCKFINREQLIKWGIFFDEEVSWGEDLIFHFKLLEYVKQARVIDDTGYFYRINEASVTQRYDPQTADRFLLMTEIMEREVERTGDKEMNLQFQVFVVKHLLQSVQRGVLNPQNPKPYGVRRKEYQKLRYSERVQNAIKGFPYKSVRAIYKAAFHITATGSYGLLWLFYQLKRIKEKKAW